MIYFPHCGRTFVCEDTVGITDIRQARSAYAFALTYGQQQVNAHSNAFNTRAGSFVSPYFQVMFDEPLVGFTNGNNFMKSAAPYYQRMPFEVLDSHDMASITIGFRFMDEAEAMLLQSSNGTGRRGQRVTINLVNLANGVNLHVLDIFYDLNWYTGNVSPIIGANVIDLATNYASQGFSASGLQQDGHNVITILKALPASFRQINRAAAGSLQISYEFPKNGNGGNWTGLAGLITSDLTAKTHPLSGAPMSFCGINEAELRTYRTDTWTQGTLPATATLSRAYALTPIPAWPSMGDTYTAGVHNSLNAFATSIKGLGYVGAKSVGANRGGYIRPMIGASYRFNDQLRTLTFWGEIPEGATQWMLLAYVKTENYLGLDETIRFRINADGFQTLSTTSTTSSGSTVARWHYATGTLSAFNQPTNGQVNRCQVIIEVEKTAYAVRNNNPSFYWDGVNSFLLKFF